MFAASTIPGDFGFTLQGKEGLWDWYFCEQQVQGGWVFLSASHLSLSTLLQCEKIGFLVALGLLKEFCEGCF